ncbi:MAG: fatty acid desaturase [Planctomycetes bacterium]|nr:fatty acid desaturase [Planctomycetota bacterium]
MRPSTPLGSRTADNGAIGLPKGTRPLRVNFQYLIVIGLVHLASLLAFVPWFFSWIGVASFVISYFLFGIFGITVGFHRLLSHRSFECPKWFEYCLALLGTCCLQESAVWWVAVHRRHHLHADDQSDPHTPAAGIVWSHFGWLFLVNRDHLQKSTYHDYARDMTCQTFYVWTDHKVVMSLIVGGHMIAYFAIGFWLGWLPNSDVMSGVRIGASVLVWGVFLRTALVMHAAWSINSMTHLWGYRSHELPDDSRNNWLLGLLVHGEGWHNNHHANANSASFGQRWWEIDTGYWAICLLQKVGLARNVVSR